MGKYIKNPKHWRDRAEETRAKADRAWSNDDLKEKLLRIAVEYDQLAERAEQWQESAELLKRSL
jgi:hypothetical protein